MAQIYRTKSGDMLDWICWKKYGKPTASGTVEAVLDANPGLADKGPVYSAGMLITLPELPESSKKEVIRLWD